MNEAELARIEGRMARNRKNWYMTIKHPILEMLGARFTEGADVAADYISIAAFELGLDEATASKAVEIARKVQDAHPHLAAAVAIYITARASGRPLSVGEVAEAIGISAVSLSRKLKGLIRPERKRGKRKEMAILGPYTLVRSAGRNEYVIEGPQALELAYNLHEAGVITSADLAKIEKRIVEVLN